jgi:hypothetical protein
LADILGFPHGDRPGDQYQPAVAVQSEVNPNELPPVKEPSYAAHILRRAESLIDGDRDVQHGNRHECTKQIARLWTAYLGVKVTQQDFCNMMALCKIGRMQTGAFNSDNAIDGAGYLALGAEVAT